MHLSTIEIMQQIDPFLLSEFTKCIRADFNVIAKDSLQKYSNSCNIPSALFLNRITRQQSYGILQTNPKIDEFQIRNTAACKFREKSKILLVYDSSLASFMIQT